MKSSWYFSNNCSVIGQQKLVCSSARKSNHGNRVHCCLDNYSHCQTGQTEVLLCRLKKENVLSVHPVLWLFFIPPHISHHTLRSLPLPGLSEVRKEEEPAPPLVANQEQRSVLLARLLKDRLQTPAGRKRAVVWICSF